MAWRLVAAATATALALPLIGSPAVADPQVDGEFAVSEVSANNQITQGPDGNMWVTLTSAGKDVAKITPAGVVTEYDSAAYAGPTGITTGPDGALWVTYPGGVARFLPATPATATATPLADITSPQAITIGPDGNLWTASADKVIKIPPASPATATSYGATGVTNARGIAAGGDGNLWVADFGSTSVSRVSTGGAGTQFPVGGGTQGVAAGPGGQVAFTQQGTPPYTIARITTSVETTPVPGTDPFGIAYGTDGAYWAAQFATNSLARLTTTGVLSTLPLPAGSGPRQVAAGPGNTLWVTLDNSEKIVRISGVTAPPTPTPTPTATPTPTPSPTPTPQLTTTITKKPKKVVRKAKVRFRFVGTAGASFQCRLDSRPWRSCTSPKTYRLKLGKHRFRVRADLNGVVDPTPAVWRFRRR